MSPLRGAAPDVSVYRDFNADLPETVEDYADNVYNVYNGDLGKEVTRIVASAQKKYSKHAFYHSDISANGLKSRSITRYKTFSIASWIKLS
jgi:hypothetical protein